MLHSLPMVREKKITRIFELNKKFKRSLKDFFSLSKEEYSSIYSLSKQTIEAISEKEELWKKGETLLKKLKEMGIQIVIPGESLYPSSIRNHYKFPPPILYLWGNVNLLLGNKVALINSRSMDEKGAKVSKEIVRFFLSKSYIPVTSNYKRSYVLVLSIAQQKGAPSIIVADRGILTLKEKGRLRLDKAKNLLISAFAPYDVGTPTGIKRRDQLIFALSDIIIAVQIRRGGIMEEEVLNAWKKGKEVMVVPWDTYTQRNYGNYELIEKGLPKWGQVYSFC